MKKILLGFFLFFTVSQNSFADLTVHNLQCNVVHALHSVLSTYSGIYQDIVVTSVTLTSDTLCHAVFDLTYEGTRYYNQGFDFFIAPLLPLDLIVGEFSESIAGTTIAFLSLVGALILLAVAIFFYARLGHFINKAK